MNERIRELIAKSTWVQFVEGVGHKEVFDKEQFAELIVKECLDIIRRDAKNFRECDIKTDLVVVEEYNKTFKYIKEHFGGLE